MEKKDIRHCLDQVGSNGLLAPIVDFIKINLNPLDEHVLTDLVVDPELTVLKLKLISIDFAFCFWPNRFSFFIENKEIIDEYLDNVEDSKSCVEFLRVIFSHQIEIVFYYSTDKKKKYKTVFKYFIKQGEEDILYEDVEVTGINFLKKHTLEKKITPPVMSASDGKQQPGNEN